MRAALITILVITAVLVGGGLIASVAYTAGLSANVVTVPATTDGATVVVPAAGYGWGWGWGGPGFGFFGFFAFLFFLFLVFGIIRALTWRGRGGWGPGGPGYWGDRNHGNGGRHPYESRAREHFTEWHREAHGEPPSTTPHVSS